jgi:hypothetical protein
MPIFSTQEAKQENLKFRASLGYIAKSLLNKKMKQKIYIYNYVQHIFDR